MAVPTLLEWPLDLQGGRGAIPETAAPAERRLGECPRQRVLRVGLVGFGRTGREVARALLADAEMRLEWVLRRSDALERRSASDALGVESDDPGAIHSAAHVAAHDLLGGSPVDVVIDFSAESGLDFYGTAAATEGVAIVTAVSHYSDARQRSLERYARSTPVLWSPNITLGINFMLLAAQTLQRIAPAADVQIVEEHFRDKAGASGTALRLARALDLPDDAVHGIRAGGIIGVHEVLFGLPTQTVRLRHEALSREAFGSGAMFAARHVVDREAGLYRMEDLLLPYFADHSAPGVSVAPRRGGARGRIASRLRALARRLD